MNTPALESLALFDPSGGAARFLAQGARHQPDTTGADRAFDTSVDIRALASRVWQHTRDTTLHEQPREEPAGWPVTTALEEPSYRSRSIGAWPGGWEPSSAPVDGILGGVAENKPIEGGIAEEPVGLMPQQARHILDALSPYLFPVTEAISPLLGAHGLSADSATVSEVLAIEGLAESLFEASWAAISLVDVGDSLSSQRYSPEMGMDSPSGASHPLESWEELDFGASVSVEEEPLPPGWQAKLPPVFQAPDGPDVALPAGWETRARAGGGFALGFDEPNGDPCYPPNVPGFEGYEPKCEVPPEPACDGPCRNEGSGDCLDDPIFSRADERLRSGRNFSRIPTRFRGDEAEGPYDYREKLEESVSLDKRSLYRCRLERDTSQLAKWAYNDKIITLYRHFYDLQPFNFVESLIEGPISFRAGALLHEHVHRIEDPGVGTVQPPENTLYEPIGSVGERCTFSGTEYNGAYIQAKYYGGTSGVPKLVAELYALTTCEELSRVAKWLAAADEIIAVLGLGWLKAFTLTTTLAALGSFAFSKTEWLLGFLSGLVPHNVAVFLVLILLGYPQ